MDTLLWTAQGFLVLLFAYSGLMKSTQSVRRLVSIGQTGVEHLSIPLIRFIGLSELFGAAGLLVPGLMHQWPVITSLAAFCLGLIMIPAAVIHYWRGEFKAVAFNGFVFVVSLWVAYGRWPVA